LRRKNDLENYRLIANYPEIKIQARERGKRWKNQKE
jgi:hypothetical protein